MNRRTLLSFLAMAPRDARSILEAACSFDEGNLAKLRPYTWTSEETTTVGGRVTRSQTYEINLVSGSLYWRLTKRNGDPISGIDAEAEQRRLERHLAQAKTVISRVAGAVWREERRYLDAIPLLQDYRYTGDEMRDGRNCHVIQTKPRRGQRHDRELFQLVESFAYKIWVDAREFQWVHAEINVEKRTKYLLHQLPLGRITFPYSNNIVNQADHAKGSRIEFSLLQLPGGAWTLDRYVTRYRDYQNELRYFNYRQFSTDSQLLTDPL
jgi:hypothetical protein